MANGISENAVPDDGFREDIVQPLFIIWARFPTLVPAMQAPCLHSLPDPEIGPRNTRKGREKETRIRFHSVVALAHDS